MSRWLVVCCGIVAAATGNGQSVILPMPRLLTTMPMGGNPGTTLEVAVTGQHLDGASEFRFSDPRVTATPVASSEASDGNVRYQVTIAADCPLGLVEATVLTRLGVSSPRVFTISALPEVIQTADCLTLETAFAMELDSVCNATIPARGVNHYRFQCEQGQRVIIDCAAKGIESKLNPVLILADHQGRDLVVERRGDVIDFTAPENGSYVIKVHDLTFKGGSEYFCRLSLRRATADEIVPRSPRVATVSSFSWPPAGLSDQPADVEHEPNNSLADAQSVTLPCDLSGQFATAADVDLFRFDGKQGDVWWIEVASERLGHPTDPSLLVQRLSQEGDATTLHDVVELNDIASPIKVSSNHYAYDGPPYHAGSPDVLGQFAVPEDGQYVIRLVDLFGGTRNDPRCEYRMIVRRASPDFSLVAWAMHMELRNGDRNAVSKPMALRGGSTMPLEVVVIRRDGFQGPIELFAENLPDGVTAQGITIAEGQNRGYLLLTADPGAPTGNTRARLLGRALIDGQAVVRECRLASMAWPVNDHWSEIPSPRLLQAIDVSVSGSELAPMTIAPREDKVWQAMEGETLRIPLLHLRRSEFSGSVMNAQAMGRGFEPFRLEIPLDADASEAVMDLAALKTPPGDYVIAFYGGAVTKFRHNHDSAETKDIADIVVSQPISIRVLPAVKP
jgi:hypothetical protein